MSESRIGRTLVIVAAVVVAATVVAALMVTGLPGEQRIARLDERRVTDLQGIEAAIEDHARQQGTLPPSLVGLAGSTNRTLGLLDPETGAAYEYAAVDLRRYRLCARFGADSRAPAARTAGTVQGWQHPAGRHCFTRTLPADVGTRRAAGDAAH